MATITVREKEHWKERITRKLEQAIDQLLATTDPGFLERISHQAKQQALESLGLSAWQAVLDELAEQEVAVQKERQHTYRQMVMQLTQVPECEQPRNYYSEPPEIRRVVAQRQAIHEERLLADDPLGRQVLVLRREKEELLDTVWLASSGKQIRHLWSRVAALLNQEPTPFQQQALEMDPVDEE